MNNFAARDGATLFLAIYALLQTANSASAQQVVPPGDTLTPPGTVAANGLPSVFPAAGPLSTDELLPEERINIAVYEKCNRCVVHIATKSRAMASYSQVAMRAGTGSGSIINQEGMILTNQHVIDGVREVSVSLFNGLSYPAVLVGQDPDTDIAVIKIDAPRDELVPVEWGDSSGLRVGQRIYAIGNPFGLERTMSTGMISSLNRQIPSRKKRATMRSLIQIDASINQGNSGGPLLNTRGQLIGMNTAIMSSDGDSAGVGFAIPVTTISRIVPQLIQDGRVIRPTIGIRRVYQTERGLLIVEVAEGGPAEQAGLNGFSLVTRTFQQGPYRYPQTSLDTSTADLIISVDGLPTKSTDDLLRYIESKRPGDTIVLTIIRNDRQQTVQLTLGES